MSDTFAMYKGSKVLVMDGSLQGNVVRVRYTEPKTRRTFYPFICQTSQLSAVPQEHWTDGSDDPDVCPNCNQKGGEYTATLDACAFCYEYLK